ncbi:hypothetical protein RB600_000601 [Gaeumannomyces tritici]
MVPSVAASARSLLAKLGDEAEDTYVLLAEAVKENQTHVVGDLKALRDGLGQMCIDLKRLSLHLPTLDNPEKESPPPSGPYNLGRLSACQETLSGLARALRTRTSSSIDPDHVACAHEVIQNTLTTLKLALEVSRYSLVLKVLSGRPQASPTWQPSATKIPALIPIRIPKQLRPGHRILDALCTTDHSAARALDLLAARCPGTADWVLTDHSGVKDWMQGNHKVLHLSGSSGCGKSVIAATIVNHLAQKATSPTWSLCYFFIDPRVPCNPTTILGTLLAQIMAQSLQAYSMAEKVFALPEVENDNRTTTALRSRHDTPDDETVRWVSYKDPQVLAKILRAAMQSFSKNHVVIDGINHLPPSHQSELLRLLCTLDWERTNILIMGRPIELETFRLQNCVAQKWEYNCCSISASSDDLRIFVKRSTDKLAQQQSSGQMLPQPLLPEFLEATADALAESKNFQYVQYQLWYFRIQDLTESQPPRNLPLPQGDSWALTYTEMINAIVERESKLEGKYAKSSASDLVNLRSVIGNALSWLLLAAHTGPGHFKEFSFSKRCFFEALSLALAPNAESLQELEPASDLELRFSFYFEALMVERTTTVPLGLAGLGTSKTSAPVTQYSYRHWSFVEYLMTPTHGSVLNVNLEKASTSLALAALRYMGLAEFKQTVGGIKLLQQRAYERQIHNPFYSLAAGWLPEMLRRADWTSLKSRLLVLFDATERDSSILFFLEYFNYHFPWVYELTSLYHTPKALIQLVDELAAGRLTAFHIAVSLGLPDVCRGTTEKWSESDKLALFGKSTAYGPPLALAILGPRAFAISESETWQDFFVPLRQEKTSVSSIDVRGTILYLLEQSGRCSTKLPSRIGGGISSLAASALMRCAFLNDADLFIHLMKAKLWPPISLDSTFIQVFDDIFFPDLGSHATPVVLYNTLARYHRRALSTDARVFLDKICEYMMDRHMDLVLQPPGPRGGAEEEDLDLLLTTAWNCAFRYELACAKFPQERGDPEIARRPINCSDPMYSRLRERSLREFKPYQMLRLMQDPRWDVNQPLENRGSEMWDENAGQTALHVTVENKGEVAYMLAKVLIRTGANVFARDARGRTPLHMAESESMLKLLLGHGAESQAQDLDGRTVWHVAAANNDARTLRELVEWHRPKMEMLAEALRCVTKQRRTPLAEAIAYFHERPRSVNVKSPELVEPVAAEVLLPLCKGNPLTFRSNIPLVHLAAEWGRESFLVALDEAGAIEQGALTAKNLTAFHFLNVGASQSFVKRLGRVYGAEFVAVLSSAGNSAVEAFMSQLADVAPPPNSNSPNLRPPVAEQLVDPAVFQTLLAPSVVRSKDKEGRTFWERFCYNVIAAYCHKFREGQSVAVDAICRISEAAGMSEAIKFHEEQTQITAFVPLVKAVWTTSKYIPSWFSVPCLAVLLNTASLGAAGTDESVVLTLKWAILGGKSRLVELLLERGASVHAPARGHSVLEEFHKYDVVMFQVVLQHAEKAKLNTLDKHGRAPIHYLVCESEANDGRGGGAAGRPAKISALAKAGADVNRLTDDRMSPVILAAMKSNQESANALLDLGADTSIRLPDGLDISLAAASRGCVLILRKLMSLGFPARDWVRRFSITVSLAKEVWKKRIYQGCHALHIAALNCQVGSLRFYLEEHLIPVGDPCFDHKMTALHFAAIGGASDAIRYLVAQGADINAPDVTGLTPLHVGVQARHPDSVRTLLSLGANRALRDREGRTPLLLAIQWNVHLCYNLLKEDASQPKTDVDSKQPTEGQSSSSAGAVPSAARPAKATRYMAEALENSVMMGDLGALSFLLQDGCPADATMPSCGECSALGLAVWTAKYPVVKFLLDRGVRRFTTRCQKHSFLKVSALFEAAVLRPQAPHCLALILDAALRDGTNWLNSHFTPLHIAVQQSNLVSVNIVLKHIASNAAAYRKWLPVSPSGPSLAATVASGAARPAAGVNPVVREIVNRQVRLLFADDEYHMEPTTALHMAIMSNSIEITRALVNQGGADVDGVDWELSTPLHRAVNNGFSAGVDFLVEMGASTNIRDRDGNTPLIRAARAGRVDPCRLLITKGGADTTVRDLDGMSLLSCCAEKSSSPALFHYLSSSEVGLDPYARDKTNYSPLHDAVLNSKMTAYVFSGRWDFERVARGSDLFKGFFALVVDDGDGRSLLPRLHRRWPRAEWSRYVNACPPRYLSPLCLAAARGLLWELGWLLHHGGADPELEGSAEGTALMAACSHGRLEAVKMLVRSSARVAYVKRPPGGGDDDDGTPVVQNALEHARGFPEIVRWLLVGRYTDQGKISDRPHDAAAAAAAAAELRGRARPTEGVEGAPGIGRALQVRYVLTGTNREYGRLRKESMRAYLLRAAEIRLSLRGEVIVPFEDQFCTQPFSIV